MNQYGWRLCGKFVRNHKAGKVNVQSWFYPPNLLYNSFISPLSTHHTTHMHTHTHVHTHAHTHTHIHTHTHTHNTPQVPLQQQGLGRPAIGGWWHTLSSTTLSWSSSLATPYKPVLLPAHMELQQTVPWMQSPIYSTMPVNQNHFVE